MLIEELHTSDVANNYLIKTGTVITSNPAHEYILLTCSKIKFGVGTFLNQFYPIYSEERNSKVHKKARKCGMSGI